MIRRRPGMWEDKKMNGNSHKYKTITSSNPVRKLWELRAKVPKQLIWKCKHIANSPVLKFRQQIKEWYLLNYIILWQTTIAVNHILTQTPLPYVCVTLSLLMLWINFSYWASVSTPCVWLWAPCTKFLAGQQTFNEEKKIISFFEICKYVARRL